MNTKPTTGRDYPDNVKAEVIRLGRKGFLFDDILEFCQVPRQQARVWLVGEGIARDGVARMPPGNRFEWDEPEEYLKARRFYVYAWFDGDRLLYVGKGKFDRVITPHAPRAEALRTAAQAFRYEILDDDLEEAVALATEKSLIKILNPPGNVIHTGRGVKWGQN